MTNDDLRRDLSRDVAANTVLFSRGDDPGPMYVILAGKVEIRRFIGDAETTAAVLSVGDMFGEMAIFNGEPRSATALVLEDARLLEIGADALEKMILGSSEIAVRLIRMLAERLADAGRQVEILMRTNPTAMVVECLKQEANRIADFDHASSGDSVRLPLSVPRLAARVALSEEAVTGILERLARAHLLLEWDSESIVVVSSTQLEDFLELMDARGRQVRLGDRDHG